MARASPRGAAECLRGRLGRVTFYVSEMDVGRLVRRKRSSSECERVLR